MRKEREEKEGKRGRREEGKMRQVCVEGRDRKEGDDADRGENKKGNGERE